MGLTYAQVYRAAWKHPLLTEQVGNESGILASIFNPQQPRTRWKDNQDASDFRANVELHAEYLLEKDIEQTNEYQEEVDTMEILYL